MSRSGLDDGGQQVVGGVEVVADGVALVPRRLHRVRRCPLLGEVDDRVRLPLLQPGQQPVVVVGDVEAVEADLLAAELLPDLQAGAHRRDRGEGRGLELDVGLAAGEVVDDVDVVTLLRQMQCGRPPTESVATENQDLHKDTLH